MLNLDLTAVLRVRPKATTVAVILAGPMTLRFAHQPAAAALSRLAAPMIGSAFQLHLCQWASSRRLSAFSQNTSCVRRVAAQQPTLTHNKNLKE